MKATIAAGIACALLWGHAGAAARDPRIQVEQYDQDRVVEIYTGVGVPTVIQFERDERIVGTPEGMVGMGDGKAWITRPKANKIMLKPAVVEPDTYLLVVTNKRTYAFEIISAKKRAHVAPTLVMRFEYPDSKLAQTKAETAKQAAVAERLQEIAGQEAPSQPRNRNYMRRGSAGIAPKLVEDDGRFTYMRFDDPSTELPQVYKVLPNGQEVLTDGHMEPDTGTWVVHETASLFMLRYGTAVVALRNDGWKPGRLNPAGATAPRTLRMDKEAN